jgi:protein-tyrosine-phosphatase
VPQRFETVFLCTGNRARSPLAAALLLRRVDSAALSVRSLGTLDVGPLPPLPEAVAAGRRLGVEIDSHRAATLQQGELAGVDLVIGFEPFHVSAAVVDGRAPRERVFSILELVELLRRIEREVAIGDVDEDPRMLIAAAHARRSGDFLSVPAIEDPWGRPPAQMRRTAERLDALVEVVARVLFRVPAPVH